MVNFTQIRFESTKKKVGHGSSSLFLAKAEGMGVIVDGHAAGEHAKKQIELSRNRTYIENLEGLCPIH